MAYLNADGFKRDFHFELANRNRFNGGIFIEIQSGYQYARTLNCKF